MSQTAATHTDSVDGQDPANDTQKKVKSRRPANTAFRQQRLKAWQPILTPKTVLPLFFLIGIIFAPIGGLLLYASSQVEELSIDYSECTNSARSEFTNVPSDKVSSSFKSSNANCSNIKNQKVKWKTRNETDHEYRGGTAKNPTPICTLQFPIPNNIGPPVLLYYRLTNFYQNHRRYVKSLDTDQLKGDAVSVSTIKSGSCDPLRVDDSGKPYYPCGLIANSLFNDSFNDPVNVNVQGDNRDNQTYDMTNKGIAWDSDKALYGKTKYKAEDIAVPPNWQEQWPKGYTEDNLPDLEADEEFQVWMRTAGLPAFSKLALRNDNQTMKCGMYQLDIVNTFPVTEYGGTKSILISTRTVIGGKNPFLGIAYVVVGGICVLLGALFTVAHLIKPRKLGDHTYLTWNNDQPSTATATGIQRPGNEAA